MEETVDPQTESGAGFEPTTVRQFTVFLENRVGRLTLLMQALEESTRVVGMAIMESAEAALARIICSDADAGRDMLQSHGFAFSETNVLIIALPTDPQPLLAICSALLGAEISIHSAYPLLLTPPGPAVVIYCDDLILASQLLIRKGYRIVGQSDLGIPPAEEEDE